ncbi:MAG TPA: DUF2237 domain-containing protein [Oligoflexia bacterium]|nr:DUF2237 domain-containing protein [Oligoflexia bacterium]HMR25805.1 DUF2237 domain-containing protein [Oligoflexia bacterium]
MQENHKNIYGDDLIPCCFSPKTGFYRDGYCKVGEGDHGVHAVCVELTDAFLQFSLSRGNDLMTPRPEMDFPGLKAGDKWCLCASRWQEAFAVGAAPKVFLASTHEKALEICDLEDLKSCAVDLM